MPMIGCGDADSVDVFTLRDLAEVVHGVAWLTGAAILGVMLVDLSLVHLAAEGIHVTNSHNFDLRILEEFIDQSTHLLAHSNEAHANAAVRSGIS